MGLMQREKGKTFERWAATFFRELFPSAAERIKRVLLQARDGAEAPDLVGVPFFWVEAKHHRLVNLHAALRQAERARKAYAKIDRKAAFTGEEIAVGLPEEVRKLPLVIARNNREDPVILMRAEDFATFLRALTIGITARTTAATLDARSVKELPIEVTAVPPAEVIPTVGPAEDDTAVGPIGALVFNRFPPSNNL